MHSVKNEDVRGRFFWLAPRRSSLFSGYPNRTPTGVEQVPHGRCARWHSGLRWRVVSLRYGDGWGLLYLFPILAINALSTRELGRRGPRLASSFPCHTRDWRRDIARHFPSVVGELVHPGARHGPQGPDGAVCASAFWLYPRRNCEPHAERSE